MVVLLGYKITKQDHTRILADIAARRAAGRKPVETADPVASERARMTEVAELDTFVSGPQPEPHAADAPAKPKLSFGNLAFYGAGSLVENATNPVLALSLFYLSALCGLSGSQAGFVAMLTLVVDSACDPLVGSISDNSRSRHGRRHPFMLLSLLPIFVAFGLLFSVPMGLTGTPLFLYALVTLFAARIGLSFFIVPYMGLGAELSDDYAERSTIVSARVLYSIGVALVMAILGSGSSSAARTANIIARAIRRWPGPRAPSPWLAGWSACWAPSRRAGVSTRRRPTSAPASPTSRSSWRRCSAIPRSGGCSSPA